MSVADRLRVESDQALALLQESHRTLEEQLSQVLSREAEKDEELRVLRAERAELCRRLSELTLRQERAELDARRNTGIGDRRREEGQDGPEEAGAPKNEANEESKCEGEDREDDGGSEKVPLRGKGVAEGYLRSLAALEKKTEDGCGQRNPRRIAMLSERSW